MFMLIQDIPFPLLLDSFGIISQVRIKIEFATSSQSL